MNSNLRLFIGCTVITAFAAAYTFVTFPHLPEQIPVHFNAAGVPDRYESKTTGAWLMIYVMAGMALMFTILPVLSPKTKSIEEFRKTYDSICYGTMLFMVGIHYLTLSAAGKSQLSNLAFGLLMCGLFGFLGNMLGKVTPNYFVGIRTPWTLESPENWERTHRLAARLSVATAGIGAVLILLGVSPVLPILLCASSLIAPVGYSYWLYNQSNKSNQAPN